MDSKLAQSVNLAARLLWRISILSLVVTVAGITIIAAPRLRSKATEVISGRPSMFSVGAYIDADLPVYKQSDFTVLLFARSTCPACQKAAPFIKELRNQLSSDGRMPFILMTTETLSDEEVAYGSAIGLEPSQILSAPLSVRRHLSSVPTVIIVDKKGTIRFMNTAGLRSVGQAIELAARARKSTELKFLPG